MIAWSNVYIEVAPITVFERVAAAIVTSPINLGLIPPVSVKNILNTLAPDAAAVACELINLTPSTLVPSVTAVTNVTKVPDPSDAVFAAAILAGVKLPCFVKIGVVEF